MKYVRTKDNIYEIVNDYGGSCAVKSRGKRGKTAIDGFIIKYGLTFAPRSDTIEELCEGFCLLGNDGTKLVYNISDWLDLKENILSNKAWIEIYGAIWTPKGLIYVAKMNDKGELELLWK